MAPITRTITLTLVLVMAGGTLVRPQGAAGAAADLQGKLYKSVFSSGIGALSAADVKALAEPLRGRLEKYLARRTAFKSNYKSEADSFETVRVDAKRRLLEQAIVSLIEAPGIERSAADYVTGAPIHYEWKGLPDGPLEEANQAEALLQKDPGSPLAPWFAAFIAQRQRVIFETQAVQKNEAGDEGDGEEVPDLRRAGTRGYRSDLRGADGRHGTAALPLSEDDAAPARLLTSLSREKGEGEKVLPCAFSLTGRLRPPAVG